MTSTQYLIYDNSTLANFKQWGSAISAFFTTAGWMQTTDTGQVNWSSIGSVPGSGAYVYEIWEPNDGLTAFYLRLEYGNFSGSTNAPSLRFTIGTGTNGAGVITGVSIGPVTSVTVDITAPSTTIPFECDFSGVAGRMGMLLWRNSSGTNGQMFAIERSINSSGVYTASYVTLWTCGPGPNASSDLQAAFQGTLSLTLGPSPNTATRSSNAGGWIGRFQPLPASTTSAFNNSVPFDTCSPNIGYFDYPCTVCGMMTYGDATEGSIFSTTIYGSSHSYIMTKLAPFCNANPMSASGLSGILVNYQTAMCMRFD